MQLLPGGPASPLGPEKGKIILQKTTGQACAN